MNRLIKLKQIHIEGGDNSACFNWRYVVKKNRLVLNKTIQRARLQRDRKKEIKLYNLGKLKKPQYQKLKISELKIFIVEIETEAGYLNQSYPNDDLHYKELSREEISLLELKKMFK